MRKHRSDGLVALADRKLREDMKSGEAAAILIWLRCVGERGLIERSIEGFEGLPYQKARYLLISSAVLDDDSLRSEEHTSELQSLMRISYAVFCLKKKKISNNKLTIHNRIHSTQKHITQT